MLLRLLLASALSLLLCVEARAQTAGWEFPTAAAVSVGAADNGKILASDQVPGASVTVTLPNPATVGAGWLMGFSTGAGKGIIVNPPVNVFILTGQKQMTSFSAPSNENYEYFTLSSDGTNFRLTSATRATSLINGIIPAAEGAAWTFLQNSGYAATLADNGTVLTSISVAGPNTTVTVTLPSAPLLLNGWAISMYAGGGNPMVVQPNPVQGALLIAPPGFGQNPLPSFMISPGSAAIVNFDGANFHLFLYTPATIPAVVNNTILSQTSTAVAPNGIWRLSYTNNNVSSSPPLFFLPLVTGCSFNGGAGDGGVQVPSADGKCWAAKYPPGPLDVRQWGADQLNADNYPFVAAAMVVAGLRCSQVYFPQGKYFINSQVVVPPCAGIKGDGRPQGFSTSGMGTLLDFTGLPANTAGIVTGEAGTVSQMVVLDNFQVQNATANCMTLAIQFSTINNVSAVKCAGEGIHLDTASDVTVSNVQLLSNGQFGISLNGTAGIVPPNVLNVVLQNVGASLNTLDGFFLNNVTTTTIVGSKAVNNGTHGFNVVGSTTVTFVGTYARLNSRVGYSIVNSRVTLEGVRAESNNTSHQDAADAVLANNSNVNASYMTDDVAPSGNSIDAINNSTVHSLANVLAGATVNDSGSINDRYGFTLQGRTTNMGGGALSAGQCTSQTVSIPGILNSINYNVTVSPAAYPGDGFTWSGFVPAAGQATVKLCAIVAGTPAITTYNVYILR